MAQKRTDRRFDKSKLPLADALVDAWLVLVQGCERTVFAVPERVAYAMPLPRVLGYGAAPDGAVVAVVPGEHLRWLLSRKTGFSVAERYLADLRTMLARGRRVRLLVWDIDEELPHGLIDKLEVRVGEAIERVGPEHVADIVDAIGPHVGPDLDPQENWLLESWRFLRRFPGALKSTD
jgi:hypothetical protein